MIRKTLFAATLAVFLGCGSLAAQGVLGGTFNQYMVNQPASNSIGMSSPIPAVSLTDCPNNLNCKGFPIADAPVAMLIDRGGVVGTTIVINAWNMFGLQIDLRDKGANGYGEQVLFSGFVSPVSPATHTTVGGNFTTTASIPACIITGGVATCITNSAFDQFEISSQAILTDPTKMFNLSMTPATQGVFDNGYREFPGLTGDNSVTYTFKQGFSFNFYGLNFTQASISANGFVSFGQVDTSFPTITVNTVRTGVRRIMSFYNDLVPEPQFGAPGPFAYPTTRIYAQQFCDANGLTKVKFVHDHLAEFSDTTGPHGGEIVITDDDDIAVFVPGYNGIPSINTVVGITPGNAIDTSVPTFGEDLSVRFGSNTGLGLGGSGYEYFDYGPPVGVSNPIDLIGFANNQSHPVGPGIVFLKDDTAINTAPNNSRYIVQ